MSQITLSANASGSAIFTVAAPGTSTNQTLTLPDATATLVGDSATQTLTNKTIGASQLTGALPAIDGSALTGLAQIGVGQTWQNVTGSRALDTNYTNSTSKPIMVNIQITQGSGGKGKLRVNGVDVAGQNIPSVGTDTMVSAIVPAGSVYQMATTAGTQTIALWSELR